MQISHGVIGVDDNASVNVVVAGVSSGGAIRDRSGWRRRRRRTELSAHVDLVVTVRERLDGDR